MQKSARAVTGAASGAADKGAKAMSEAADVMADARKKSAKAVGDAGKKMGAAMKKIKGVKLGLRWKKGSGSGEGSA